MNILALVKYSLDVAEIKTDPATHELRLAGVPEKIGHIDRNVVEAAVRLKEANGGTVRALCLEPLAAREGIKDILAMGVDSATLVEDPCAGQAEAAVAVDLLAAAIAKLGQFDLILCGFASDDGYSFQVGPRLAERLAWPLISYARRLAVTGAQLEADRDLEDCLETVTAPLPALVSIAEEAFPPRRTTLMEAIKAKKKPVNTWQAVLDLGLTPDRWDKPRYQERTALTGIVVQRRQQVLKGTDMPALADTLIDVLLSEHVVKGAAQ